MKISTYIVLIFFITVGGCSTSNTITNDKPVLTADQKLNWKLITGKWYTKLPNNKGGYKEILSTKQADGTYVNEFRTSDSTGKRRLTIEVGEWAISGNIYFTSFRGWLKPEGLKQSDPSNPYNYDAYIITELTENTFNYEHVHTGNSYITNKVSSDFELPKLNQVYNNSFKNDRQTAAAF